VHYIKSQPEKLFIPIEYLVGVNDVFFICTKGMCNIIMRRPNAVPM
jgi:hypothetical protein